jgi:septal ring factor EnvC (AmiA/AmiB activator)
MLGKVLTVASLVFWCAHAGAGEYARSLAELEVLKSDIRNLQQEVNATRKKEDAVTRDLDRVEQALASLNAEIRSQVLARNTLNEEISLLNEKAEKLDSQRADAILHLGKLMRSIYILGEQSGLRMLVSQQDPHVAARRLTMFKYVTVAKNNQLRELIDLHSLIDENRASFDVKTQNLDKLIGNLARNKESLKVSEKERIEQLKKVRRALAADRSQIELYKQREQTLERLLTKLKRAPDKKIEKSAIVTKNANNSELSEPGKAAKPEAKLEIEKEQSLLAGFGNNRGTLSLPLKADIEAKFGQKKQESGLRWEGVLFNSSGGQSVRAIYPGQVVFSDWFRGYGQLMVLDHGDGYMSLYGHNQDLQVGIGDIVQANQVIALAGESGQTLSPGLYFEIRHNGNPDDPLKWCR